MGKWNPDRPRLIEILPGAHSNLTVTDEDGDRLNFTYEDETFDFIFLDAWLNYDQVKRELNDWYCKLKHGGLFIGHDYKSDAVSTAVSQFRDQHSIKSHMSVYDSTFVWKKGGSEW